MKGWFYMIDFTFYSPTEFVFGRSKEESTGALVKKYGGTKVLIHYGGGSVIKSGLLKRIQNSLKQENIEYVLLGGAQPNPIDTLVYEGIDLCKKEQVDFILAVGGGSSIDSAKAIAAGARYDGDFWDFYAKTAVIQSAIKVATVLTIPAAGSEGSGNSVITKVEGKLKNGTSSPHLRPVFSIMNPELTFTLPSYQASCGIVDMMAHIMERYFTTTPGVQISDRLCEAALLTIIEQAPIVLSEPENYDARANIMWAGTIAHNGTCGVGRVEDWSSHALEHELSAYYDVTHGAGLAVIFPAWMKFVVDTDVDRFVQFASRVWGIDPSGDKNDVALKGIQALENFFVSIGMPIRFEELGAKKEDIDHFVKTLEINKGKTLGGFRVLTMADAKKIYELAL